MNDLLAKVEAAIAETERIAQDAAHCFGATWTLDVWDENWLGVRAIRGQDDNVIIGEDCVGMSEGSHIVRHDPARVLRRVARDRKLLELHYLIHRDVGWMEDGDETTAELPVCGHCVPKHSWFKTRAEVPTYPCATVSIIAEDYEIQVED